jgi:excisionase family DNA binding protein
MDERLRVCLAKLAQAEPETIRRVETMLSGQACDKPDSLITLTKAAALLSISRSTLWRMLKDGQLPHVSVGSAMKRIRMSDVQRLVAGGCPCPGPGLTGRDASPAGRGTGWQVATHTGAVLFAAVPVGSFWIPAGRSFTAPIATERAIFRTFEMRLRRFHVRNVFS